MHSSVRRMTDGAMMIAIMGALLLINRFLGGAPIYYLLFLLPLPMVFYSSKYGWKTSLAVYAALILLTFMLATPLMLFYVAAESLLGIVYGAGIHDHVPQRKGIVLCILIGIVINVVDLIVIASLLGYDMPMQIAELTGILKTFTEQTNLAVPETVNLAQMAAELLLVSAVVGGALQGYITHVLSRFMLKRLHFDVEKAAPFLDYFPPKWSGYLALGGYLAYAWTLGHPISNLFLEYAVQGLGMIGYLYLLFFGWFAVMLGMAVYLRMRLRFLAGTVAMLLCLILPIVMVIAGFLYIAGDLHGALMKGSFHATKDE